MPIELRTLTRLCPQPSWISAVLQMRSRRSLRANGVFIEELLPLDSGGCFTGSILRQLHEEEAFQEEIAVFISFLAVGNDLFVSLEFKRRTGQLTTMLQMRSCQQRLISSRCS